MNESNTNLIVIALVINTVKSSRKARYESRTGVAAIREQSRKERAFREHCVFLSKFEAYSKQRAIDDKVENMLSIWDR